MEANDQVFEIKQCVGPNSAFPIYQINLQFCASPAYAEGFIGIMSVAGFDLVLGPGISDEYAEKIKQSIAVYKKDYINNIESRAIKLTGNHLAAE